LSKVTANVNVTSSGGGDVKVTSGTFKYTVYPGTTTFEIEHGLPKKPKAFAVFQTEGPAGRPDLQDGLIYVGSTYTANTGSKSKSAICYGGYGGNPVHTTGLINSQLYTDYGIYADGTKIYLHMDAKGISIANAVQYFWVAFSEEALS
jgi:hypothetical protein